VINEEGGVCITKADCNFIFNALIVLGRPDIPTEANFKGSNTYIESVVTIDHA